MDSFGRQAVLGHAFSSHAQLQPLSVFDYLDRLALPAPTRARLRLAALVHDAFKYREDMSVPRVSPNEHGYLASQWLAPFVDDPVLLALLELHDEGYRAWRSARWGAEGQERVRLERLVARLPHDMNLYATFYWANNQTDGKDQSQLAWFARRLGDLGYELSPLPFRSFPVGRLAASPSSFFRQVFRQEFDHE